MANAKNVNVATTANITWGIPSAAFDAIDDAVEPAKAPLTGATSTGNYTGDEGIEVSNDTATTNIMAHQNSALVRVIVTSATVTYKFVFIENSPAVRGLWYGTPEVSGKIQWKPEKRYRGNFVIDAIDEGIAGQTVLTRHVIADAEVTSVDTLTYSNSDATRYGVTITAYRNSAKAVADIYTLTDLDD